MTFDPCVFGGSMAAKIGFEIAGGRAEPSARCCMTIGFRHGAVAQMVKA